MTLHRAADKGEETAQEDACDIGNVELRFVVPKCPGSFASLVNSASGNALDCRSAIRYLPTQVLSVSDKRERDRFLLRDACMRETIFWHAPLQLAICDFSHDDCGHFRKFVAPLFQCPLDSVAARLQAIVRGSGWTIYSGWRDTWFADVEIGEVRSVTMMKFILEELSSAHEEALAHMKVM